MSKTTKQCTYCTIVKNINLFSKHKLSRDGYKSQCKQCLSLYDTNYRLLNKNKKTQRDKVYYLENKRDIFIKKKQYRDQNKETISIKRKLFRDNNKEIISTRNKKYRSTYKGKIAINNANNKYRSLKKITLDKSLPINIHHPINKELETILEGQNNKCFYCRCEISYSNKNIHLDHIIPLSKGGQHSIDNVQ